MRISRIVAASILTAVTIGGSLCLVHANGFRINHTPSVPIGLWRIEATDSPIRRGQIISFCPDNTPFFHQALARGWIGYGGCPGGWEPFFKPVIAIDGDRVVVNATGIEVNDQVIPDSTRVVGGIGEIAVGKYVLARDVVWVLSFHPRSFDSRYFGAIANSHIEGIARPVWVWP
jgi:conjugative transfer signal peptidase TraF